jgi:hypothetical protein
MLKISNDVMISTIAQSVKTNEIGRRHIISVMRDNSRMDPELSERCRGLSDVFTSAMDQVLDALMDERLAADGVSLSVLSSTLSLA